MDDLIEPQEWGMGHPLLGGVFYGLALDLEKHWSWCVSDTAGSNGVLVQALMRVITKSKKLVCFHQVLTALHR